MPQDIPVRARELYLYWRTPAAQADAALGALQNWQRMLVQDHPGLQARALRRADEADSDSVTLMEVYTRSPRGINKDLQAAIGADGDVALAPWRTGPRHLEVFESAG